MSFARPDPSSPASIADAGFNTSRRGFDQTEVRDFLRMIAAELGRLQERERFLERELRTAQTNPDLASVQVDDAALTRLLGEETARVLTTARESAVEIRHKAEEAAAQLLNEASDEAARMREEAEIEASRRRSDAAADAEAELSMAKQQGREMVNEARAYRERVLSELARRRELAREQIEQLLHGRDRLMETFERARLAAVDVVAELQPLGEPDEYVNLSPTTGPVPVMLPNAARPTESEAASVGAVGDGGQTNVGASAEAVVSDHSDEPAADQLVDQRNEASRDNEAGDEATGDEATGDEATGDEATGDEATGDEATGDEVVEKGAAVDGRADDNDGADEVGAGAADDVVVDLFSRLRAESDIVADEAVDEAVDEASDRPVDDVAAVAENDDLVGVDVDVDEHDEHDEDQVDEPVDLESEPTPFDRRDAELTPIIVASARKLKRVLADEQNEVLEALRRSKPMQTLDAVLPTPSEHAARYQSAIADELLEAATAGASMVSGEGAKLRKTHAARATSAADEVLAEWLVVPLRDRLDRCLTDGDGDNAGIGKRVRAVYREWKTQHIDEQLDDVIRMAHGRGMFAATKPGAKVVWVCDPSRQACADCDDNTLAGAIAAGMEFPTGHTAAPAHMGCRCLLLPDGS